MAYNMGPVKPHVAAAGNALGRMFGIKVIGGYASSGHIENSDHYTGTALDFMCDIPTGNRLAEYAQAHAAQYNVKYIIHNRKIWSVARASEGWRPYTYGDPHTSHVHISFNMAGGKVPTTTTAPPDTTGGVNAAPAVATGVSLPSLPGPVDEIIEAVTSPVFWLRVLMFVGGLVLVLLATGALALAQLTIRKVVKA